MRFQFVIGLAFTFVLLPCAVAWQKKTAAVYRNYHPAPKTTTTTTSTTSKIPTTTTTTNTTPTTDDYDYNYDYDYDYNDVGKNDDDDYDPAEYGEMLAIEPPSEADQGSIFDYIFDDDDDYEYNYEDDEERGGKAVVRGKDPAKMTVNDVLEYIDDIMKDVPLDDEEYYDYLEKSGKT